MFPIVPVCTEFERAFFRSKKELRIYWLEKYVSVIGIWFPVIEPVFPDLVGDPVRERLAFGFLDKVPKPSAVYTHWGNH
jgi:hypothetical protein